MALRDKAILSATSLLALSLVVGAPAFAADTMHRNSMQQQNNGNSVGQTTGRAASEDRQDAKQLVDKATQVVNKMKQDPQLVKLMKKAKGLYIVPDFGRGAVIVGGRGGAGLVVVRQQGKWSDPAFYDFGAISLGPQVGASGGSVVFLLMSQGAVDAFKSGNKVTLNAGSGFTIVNYSANAQASWGKGDIIMWSNTSGAYAGATVSATDINWDDGNNSAYYGKKTDMSAILNGKVSNADAEQLKNALPS